MLYLQLSFLPAVEDHEIMRFSIKSQLAIGIRLLHLRLTHVQAMDIDIKDFRGIFKDMPNLSQETLNSYVNAFYLHLDYCVMWSVKDFLTNHSSETAIIFLDLDINAILDSFLQIWKLGGRKQN